MSDFDREMERQIGDMGGSVQEEGLGKARYRGTAAEKARKDDAR